MSTADLTTRLDGQISELTVVLLVSKGGGEAGLLEGEHALLVLQREDEEDRGRLLVWHLHSSFKQDGDNKPHIGCYLAVLTAYLSVERSWLYVFPAASTETFWQHVVGARASANGSFVLAGGAGPNASRLSRLAHNVLKYLHGEQLFGHLQNGFSNQGSTCHIGSSTGGIVHSEAGAHTLVHTSIRRGRHSDPRL
jgi:hypothetical protein|tara:strand:- start:839 stop:1423 length:585 start_codon:yes stop_codon:yes gene_type:complete